MTTFQGVHHVALTVRDLEASAAWYERVFEAPVFASLEDEGHAFTILMRPDGFVIGLHRHDGTLPDDRFSEHRVGLDHIGFACPDREALEAWERRLDELEVEHSPITDAPYGHVLVFRDPDNIQLEFFALPS